MPSSVRILSAICENCGPMDGGDIEPYAISWEALPVLVSVEAARTQLWCTQCGAQVRIATEPVEAEVAVGAEKEEA